jgi:hypothetical protein
VSATRPSPTTPGALLCPRCGSALREDQDWCLECGLAARTRVHPPPGWRLPIAATLLVALLAAAGIAFGLAAIFDKQHTTLPAATVTTPATTTGPTATAPSTLTTPTVPTTTTGASTFPGASTATTPTTVTPATVVPGTRTPGAKTPRAGATPPQRVITVAGHRITIPAATP